MENRKVRLIDANVLKEKLLDEFNQSGAYTSYKYAIGEALDYLNEQPTIDPESLRPHGKWVWNEENECWVCSNCESSALNNYRGNSTDSNYCPNCGAEMDDIEEDFDLEAALEANTCYECRAYGDDYSTDENGEMVCNCDRCPYNSMNKED